jgi:hypothetical protein
MKFFKIIFIVAFLTNCLSNSSRNQNGIDSSNLSNSSPNENIASEVLHDDDKRQIALLLMTSKEINSKGICDKNQNIYISNENFSDLFVSKFPKKIKNCKIIFTYTKAFGYKRQNDYQVFTNWEFKKNEASVYKFTQFYDGNTGGCNFSLLKEN